MRHALTSLLTALTLSTLTACGQAPSSDAGHPALGTVVQAADTAPATETKALHGVAVQSATVSVQPSYVKGAGPDWVIEMTGANQEGALDGIRYTVELLNKEGKLFAKHGTQLYFTPQVAAEAEMQWASRISVDKAHPEADGVTARVSVTGRLMKEDMVKQTWQPLDPNNLPPARKVTLDKDGNVAGG